MRDLAVFAARAANCESIAVVLCMGILEHGGVPADSDIEDLRVEVERLDAAYLDLWDSTPPKPGAMEGFKAFLAASALLCSIDKRLLEEVIDLARRSLGDTTKVVEFLALWRLP